MTDEYIVEDRFSEDGIHLADDWCRIELNHCRECKGVITKYNEVYVKNDCGFKYIYKYGSGYCKECASKKEGYKALPEVKEKRETAYGTVYIYDDAVVCNENNWMY